MVTVDTAADGAGTRTGLLAVYLNDHLGGATGGVELARRLAREHRGTPAEPALERLAAEIGEDRSALLEIMHGLGVPVRRYKVWLGWAAEKIGRLKPNGRLVRRSPLSTVLELESLRIGVQGKTEVWRCLLACAPRDGRIDGERVHTLADRARRQCEVLDDLHTRASAEVLAPAEAGARR